MKKCLALALALSLAFLATACRKKETRVVDPNQLDPNAPAIYVDDAVITVGQIGREVARNAANLPKNLTDEQRAEAQQRLLRQAVDLLVVRQLVAAALDRSSEIITTAEIEAAKESLIEGRDGTAAESSLAMLLARARLTMEDLELNIKLDIFKNKQIQSAVQARIDALTDGYLEEYYREHPDQFTIPAGRVVSRIFVGVSESEGDAARADALASIREAKTRLDAGESFEDVALEISESPSRERGGDEGLVVPGQEAPAIDQAIFSQPVGAVGDIVETPEGFHIFLVREDNPSVLVPLDDVIRARMRDRMTREIRNEETAKYYASLRDRAVIRPTGPFAAATEEPAGEEAASPASGDATEEPAAD